MIAIRSLGQSQTGNAHSAEVSLWQLNLLRVGCLVMGGGLAVTKWPLLFEHEPWGLMEGTVQCMLVAMSVLAFRAGHGQLQTASETLAVPPAVAGRSEGCDAAERDGRRLLLTVEEAAEWLGVGRSLMYQLIGSGEVPSVRIGRLRRVTPDALNAYVAALDEGRGSPDPAA